MTADTGRANPNPGTKNTKGYTGLEGLLTTDRPHTGVDAEAHRSEKERSCLRLGEEANVAVVTHVSPIKAAVCWALGLPDLAAWRMRLDNASVTRLAPGPEGPVLLSFNER